MTIGDFIGLAILVFLLYSFQKEGGGSGATIKVSLSQSLDFFYSFSWVCGLISMR
jgi:hypothetical protein